MLTITTPEDVCDEAVQFMLAHGCRISTFDTHRIILFPEGTRREKIYPHVGIDEQFMLHLPDGCVMKQLLLRMTEQSILYYPAECRHNASCRSHP